MTTFSWPRRKAIAGLTGLAVAGAAGCSETVDPGKGGTVKIEKVPVGGGLIVESTRFVVTQPVEGEFHAFDRTCPHAQCPVTEVNGQGIICNCHGSMFDLTDGHALRGPATKGLEPATITEDGDTLKIGS